MSDGIDCGAIPLLFRKKLPASTVVAAQYVGTDTELDPKDGGAPLSDSAGWVDLKSEPLGSRIGS